MIYLTFLAALLLSGIAAYYSVVGLAAIFMGAFWPVVFMGCSLEFAKVITTSWLYRNWKTCPLLLKTYLTIAVVILMLITSMGIFGFLAKSHIDSTLNAGSNTVELKTLTMQEKIAKEKLDYLLARAKDPSTASNRLDKQIQDTQKELTEISKRKLPFLKEETKLSADIGPIKYVGDVFFGQSDDAVDKAVRLVILLIMLVFDPLAVLLLIAGNISLKQREVVVENGIITAFRSKKNVEPIQKETRVQESDAPPKEEIGESVQVNKENIAAIQENDEPEEEKVEPIVIPPETDPFTGAPTIQKVETHHEPGIYEEGHIDIPVFTEPKKLEPKYDYNAEFAFREKENK